MGAEWIQESGNPARDAGFLAALAAMGWVRRQRFEELRLVALYGVDYLRGVERCLQARGLSLTASIVERRHWRR